MTFDAHALQAAVYRRLTTQIPSVPVFDHVPQDQPYPYIRIDGIEGAPDDPKGGGLAEYDVTLSVFHKGIAGTAPVYAILKSIATALHQQEDALTVQTDAAGDPCLDGFKVVLLLCTYQTAFQQGTPDDHYYHGVQRYRALIQEF